MTLSYTAHKGAGLIHKHLTQTMKLHHICRQSFLCQCVDYNYIYLLNYIKAIDKRQTDAFLLSKLLENVQTYLD